MITFYKAKAKEIYFLFFEIKKMTSLYLQLNTVYEKFKIYQKFLKSYIYWDPH